MLCVSTRMQESVVLVRAMFMYWKNKWHNWSSRLLKWVADKLHHRQCMIILQNQNCQYSFQLHTPLQVNWSCHVLSAWQCIETGHCRFVTAQSRGSSWPSTTRDRLGTCWRILQASQCRHSYRTQRQVLGSFWERHHFDAIAMECIGKGCSVCGLNRAWK